MEALGHSFQRAGDRVRAGSQQLPEHERNQLALPIGQRLEIGATQIVGDERGQFLLFARRRELLDNDGQELGVVFDAGEQVYRSHPVGQSDLLQQPDDPEASPCSPDGNHLCNPPLTRSDFGAADEQPLRAWAEDEARAPLPDIRSKLRGLGAEDVRC